MHDHPFFADIETESLQALSGAVEMQSHAKGHMLFHAGDAAGRFYLITKGWVKVFRTTSQGDEAVLAVFTKNDVLGEAAVFEGATYPFSAEVVEDAELLVIPAAFLRRAVKDYPQITQRIMVSMSREMQKIQLENEHLSIMTAPQRVGCMLLQMSSEIVGEGGGFSLPYDKSLAASRLGMKPETFSRALSQLKPFGVGVKGAEINIDSFKCLMQYVCGHCSITNGECRGAREFLSCEGGACCSGKGCGR